MKSFKDIINEGGEMYPADDMTMKEVKIACYAAQNILDRLENGAMIQRWQISAIVKASEELSSVYTSMSADEEGDDMWDDEKDEEESVYVGYEYPSMYEEVELDEVSKKTLGSYVKKAAQSRGVAGIVAGGSDYKSKDQKDALKIMKKRMTGISRATDRLTKEEVELDEVSDKKLDAYRQKAFADQPAGDDGSDKYRKRKFGRDLAFAKQTGRAKVLATKESVELDEVSTEKLRDYASAALQDKNKAKADKRWKYASKAMDTVADREVKAAHARKYNKMEEVEIYEAPLLGPKDKIHRAASADQSDKEYSHQMMFKGDWKEKNPGKQWPGYEKAGYKSPYYKREEFELEEKAYVSSLSPEMGRKGSHDVIGKDGKVVKSYPYTKDGMKGAQAHLSKMKEEVEQLDELSPSTLKSYMKKAGKSEKDLEKQHKDVSSGISKVHTAVGKKSAAEYAAHRATTQRASNKAGAQYRAADKQIKDTSGLVKQKSDIQRKLANRMDGIGRAAERLQKEAVELDEAVTVKKKDYSWGKMITVHHGSSHSFPLHPEHQEKIKKLGDGEKTSFKDETGKNISVTREGDKVHLKQPGSNAKTTVAHSHFTESFELDEQAMAFQDAEKLKNKHLVAMDHHKKSGNSKGYAAHSMVVRKFEDAYDRHGTGVIPAGRILSASQKAFKDHPHSSMKESLKLDEEADFKVSIEGLPKMFVKAKSEGDAKSKLRKVVKNPDLIKDVSRVNAADVKRSFRDFLSGKKEDELSESPAEMKKAPLDVAKVYNKKGPSWVVRRGATGVKSFDNEADARAHKDHLKRQEEDRD